MKAVYGQLKKPNVPQGATPTIACTGDLYVRAVSPLKNMDIATVSSTEFQPVEATCSKEVDRQLKQLKIT